MVKTDWDLKIILAKDAGERRAIRKRLRRSNRYAKIGKKLHTQKVHQIQFWKNQIYKPERRVYVCETCKAIYDVPDPCLCCTEGVQMTMGFDQVVPDGIPPVGFANYHDFVKFSDMVSDEGVKIMDGLHRWPKT